MASDKHAHVGSWPLLFVEQVSTNSDWLVIIVTVRILKETLIGDVRCMSFLDGGEAANDRTVSESGV